MKISIIVPVCNAQFYLSDMLNSILSQSYRDWELLLIVSKSRDNSLEICQNYARRCSKIRVFEENLHSQEQRETKLCLKHKRIILCL